jgi:5-methylcytosine-specific restriction protein A
MDVELFDQTGRRCVEAHHLIPFGDLDHRPVQINPQTDYAIVCSNCHRMIHSAAEPLTVAQLRSHLGYDHT